MKGTGIVTKLKKMNISRVALCRNPADQDASFVLVKSEDEGPEVTPVEKTELPGEVSAEEAVKSGAVTPNEIRLHLDIPGIVQKSPVLANTDNAQQATNDDDGGKDAVQECIKSLVKQCNDSKVVPKSIKKNVAEVAKYHGVEGPNVDDDGSAGAFAEITAELRAVVDILKGLAVSAAKPSMVAPEPAAPAKPAAAKPAPAKKSIDDERVAALEKQFEKTKFLLLQAMGRDPTPPGE